MGGPQSLQGRLALWLGLGLALIWAVAAFITVERLRTEMDLVFDSALEEAAQRLLPLAVRDILDRDADDSSNQRVTPLRLHDEYFTYLVRDSDGAILMRSHSADPTNFPPFSGMGFANTDTHRIYSDAALQGSITISMAEPLSHRRAAMRGVTLALGAPLLLILPLGLLAIWLVVRFSLVPLRRFRADIEARDGGDLTPISDADLPTEIRPNAVAVNQLLERLRRTLDAERSFTANSAHELRTPVAAALAQVQRLIIEAPDDITRDRARSIEAALRRLSRLSERLMQLARAQSGTMRPAGPVDLVPILRLVVKDLGAAATRIDLTLPDTPAMARIDADAFAIIARNLIENALKHGEFDKPVQVILSADGIFTVRNSGPAVAPELLERLSQPFIRGTTPAEGAGLGLAITRAIAKDCEGSLKLASPLPGQADGFEACLKLNTTVTKG